MNPNTHASKDQELGIEPDINVVAIWLRKDPKRWTAGVLAGLFAGVMMLVFAGIVCKLFGNDPLLPVKLGGLPVLGNAATALDASTGTVLVGFVVVELLCGFLGLLYSHFVSSNASAALLGVGFVWGAFAWIFINNLYIQSFRDVFAVQISSGCAFFSWQVFGMALSSVAFFDRILRSK